MGGTTIFGEYRGNAMVVEWAVVSLPFDYTMA